MSPTPAGSGKSARPVPGRTRDTDHRQRSCRAASAGAVKRGARRHLLLNKTQNKPTTKRLTPTRHPKKTKTKHTKPQKKPKTESKLLITANNAVLWVQAPN
ncbi:hypothetical protein ACRXXS_005025 [Escherichia coli]